MEILVHVVGTPGAGVNHVSGVIHDHFRHEGVHVGMDKLIDAHLKRDDRFRMEHEETVKTGRVLPPQTVKPIITPAMAEIYCSRFAVIEDLLTTSERIRIARDLGLLGENTLTVILFGDKIASLNRVTKLGKLTVNFHERHSTAVEHLKVVDDHLRSNGCRVIRISNVKETLQFGMVEIFNEIDALRKDHAKRKQAQRFSGTMTLRHRLARHSPTASQSMTA